MVQINLSEINVSGRAPSYTEKTIESHENRIREVITELKKNEKLHGEAFNFRPVVKNNYSVLQVVKIMKKNWKKVSWKIINPKKNNFYESSLLKLNSNKAEKKIKWKCILTFSETMEMVTNWYKDYDKNPKKIYNMTIDQIKKYEELLKIRSKKNL